MPTTIINSANANSYATNVRAAAVALRDGALVVFPTETVYGVAANALHAGAMQRLRRLKVRADRSVFTIHLGRPGHARRYLTSPAPLLCRLARKGWPGPLTLVTDEPHPDQTEIARAHPGRPLAELYADGEVSMRCPDHGACERLLSEVDVPVVASSANRGGRPLPFDAPSAIEQLDGDVDFVIDGGRTRYTTPSTIVEVHGHTWKIRRAGTLDERTVARLARSEVLFVCTGNSCRSPLAEYMFRQQLSRALGLSPGELAAAGYVVTSAGTCAFGGPASSGTLAELAKRDLDAGGHRAQPLTVELIHRAERIYVMSSEHRSVVLDLVPAAVDRVELLDKGSPIADPMGGGAEDYSRTAAQIERAVAGRVKEFVDEDRDWE